MLPAAPQVLWSKLNPQTSLGKSALEPNAPETPLYANPSHSLLRTFPQAAPPLPRHTTAAGQGREHQAAALHPRISTQHPHPQRPGRASKGPRLLRWIKSSASRAPLQQSHSLDRWLIVPSLGQGFSFFRQRPGDRHLYFTRTFQALLLVVISLKEETNQ